MKVAKAYQMPRSILLGRPWPAPGKPLWLPEDREWAIDYEQYLETLCGKCGTPRQVWVGVKPGEKPFVGVPHRCGGCEEIAETEDEIPEGERGKGVEVVLVEGHVYDRREDIREAADRLGLPAPAGVG